MKIFCISLFFICFVSNFSLFAQVNIEKYLPEEEKENWELFNKKETKVLDNKKTHYLWRTKDKFNQETIFCVSTLVDSGKEKIQLRENPLMSSEELQSMYENQFLEAGVKCEVVKNTKTGFLVKLIHEKGFLFTRLFLHPLNNDSCVVSYVYEGKKNSLIEKEEKWISFLENLEVHWDR